MSAHRILKDLYLESTPYDIPDPGDAGNIIVDRQFGICQMTSGAVAQTRTLPVPTKPNIYVLLNLETDGGTDITVTVTSGYDQAANTSLVFGDVGDMALLVSVPISTSAYRWRLIAADGLTVATSETVTAQTITTLTTTTLNLTNEIVTSTGVGAKNGATVTAAETVPMVHKTVLTLNSTPVVLADEAGVVAYGGTKIYDFPAGAIYFVGAVADLTLGKNSTGVNADWDGDFGVGTTAAGNNNALATTEQNVIPTTATPQAVSNTSSNVHGQSTASENIVVDGTTTAVDLYLNVLVDDADHDVTNGACQLTATGTVTVYWVNLGDY